MRVVNSKELISYSQSINLKYTIIQKGTADEKKKFTRIYIYLFNHFFKPLQQFLPLLLSLGPNCHVTLWFSQAVGVCNQKGLHNYQILVDL